MMTLPERSSIAVFIRDSLDRKKINVKLYLGRAEVDECRRQIGLAGQLRRPTAVVSSYFHPTSYKRLPGGRDIDTGIPGHEHPTHNHRQIAVHPGAITLQESFQFGQMCILVLTVYLPDKRLSGPLGAHEGILTPNEIDIAGPQYRIEIVHRHERDGLDRGFPKLPRPTASQVCSDGGQGLARKYVATYRLRCVS